MNGEITDIDASVPTSYKVYVTHGGATDGKYHSWATTLNVTGLTSGLVATPTSLGSEDLQEEAQNDIFDDVASDFLDYSESNPFGDPV